MSQDKRNVMMESTRTRCRVEKNTGPASCQCVRTWALQIDLCLGFSLFHCGLWQLKTHRGRRTDPVTPVTRMSELEAWAIVTFPPTVPWERMTSVPVSCCSRSDKTTLPNMIPPLNTHTHKCMQKTHDGCWQLVHTHTFIPSYSHVSTRYFWMLTWQLAQKKKRNTGTLQEKLKHMRAETLTTVASNIASLKGELTT